MSVRRARKPLAYIVSLVVLAAAAWMPTSLLGQSLPGSASVPGGSGGASYPVSDEVFKVCDNGDPAKCVEDELTGVTTANTGVATWTGTAAAFFLGLTGGIRAGDGSQTVPSLAWTDDADGSGSGIYSSAANTTTVTANGTAGAAFRPEAAATTAFLTLGANTLGWSAGCCANDDLRIGREAAAVLQMGIDVNAAAVNQTIKAHDGITGTDVSGAGLTLASGRGTGTGTAFVQIQTSPSLATGTTAQTLEIRDYIFSGSKTLADNSATAFVDIGVVTDDAGAVQVYYEVKAENASDQQVTSGVATVAFYNDAGTEACGAVVEAGEATAASTGTLSATITCTVSLTDEVRLNMTADSSLNVSPTLKWRIIGGTIGAVQPQ